MAYFQEPGRAEAEIEADVRDWLLGFMFSGSGDAPLPDPSKGTIATIPRGALMKDRFSRPDVLPPWLTEDDLDAYTDEFEHSGLRGPLNRYRNVDRDFEDLAAFRGARIDVPALFIGGDRDGPTVWGAPAIAAFDRTLPRLHRSIVLDGCGHWTQQERPGQVNEALVDFLGSLPASPHSPHQTDLGSTMPRTSRSSAVAWRACSPHAPDALLADPQVMQAALVAHSQKDQTTCAEARSRPR